MDLKLLRGWAWHRSFIGLCFSLQRFAPRKDSTEYYPGSATAIQMAIVLENSILRCDLYFVDLRWQFRPLRSPLSSLTLLPISMKSAESKSDRSKNATVPSPRHLIFISLVTARASRVVPALRSRATFYGGYALSEQQCPS
jgi:hypothetical protein